MHLFSYRTESYLYIHLYIVINLFYLPRTPYRRVVYKTLDIKSTQIAHSLNPPKKKIAQLSHSYSHVYTLLMGRWPGLYCDLSSLHTQKQWHESSPCPRRRWEEFLSSRVISAKVIPKNPKSAMLKSAVEVENGLQKVNFCVFFEFSSC